MELSLLVDDQLQDVQRPACQGERVEIEFEQVGGSGRVVLVENRSASGQFNNSGSDVYRALKSYCEWYDACDAIPATPTQDNVTGRTRRDAQAFPYCKSSLTNSESVIQITQSNLRNHKAKVGEGCMGSERETRAN